MTISNNKSEIVSKNSLSFCVMIIGQTASWTSAGRWTDESILGPLPLKLLLTEGAEWIWLKNHGRLQLFKIKLRRATTFVIEQNYSHTLFWTIFEAIKSIVFWFIIIMFVFRLSCNQIQGILFLLLVFYSSMEFLCDFLRGSILLLDFTIKIDRSQSLF